MFKREIEKYTKLNRMAEESGTVILGSGEDTQIPISELTASFQLDTRFYNRSATALSVTDAAGYYDAVAKALHPERVILHIGAADLALFQHSAAQFDHAYRNLIEHIRTENPRCNIGIVSLYNPNADDVVQELNAHLRMIAASQRCEFEDISTPHVWSPVETKSAMHFASAMGLHRKTNRHASLYDLAKILFV